MSSPGKPKTGRTGSISGKNRKKDLTVGISTSLPSTPSPPSSTTDSSTSYRPSQQPLPSPNVEFYKISDSLKASFGHVLEDAQVFDAAFASLSTPGKPSVLNWEEQLSTLQSNVFLILRSFRIALNPSFAVSSVERALKSLVSQHEKLADITDEKLANATKNDFNTLRTVFDGYLESASLVHQTLQAQTTLRDVIFLHEQQTEKLCAVLQRCVHSTAQTFDAIQHNQVLAGETSLQQIAKGMASVPTPPRGIERRTDIFAMDPKIRFALPESSVEQLHSRLKKSSTDPNMKQNSDKVMPPRSRSTEFESKRTDLSGSFEDLTKKEKKKVRVRRHTVNEIQPGAKNALRRNSNSSESSSLKHRKSRNKSNDRISSKKGVLRKPVIRLTSIENGDKIEEVHHLDSRNRILLRADSKEVVELSPLFSNSTEALRSITESPLRRSSQDIDAVMEGQIVTYGTPENKIVFRKENGKLIVVQGVVEPLVEQMTNEMEVDDHFVKEFLLTHTMFMTSIELMDQLITRFNVTLPPNPTTEEIVYFSMNAKEIQKRVLSVVFKWVNLSYQDFCEFDLKELVTHFLDHARNEGYSGDAAAIDKALNHQKMKYSMNQDRLKINQRLKPVFQISFLDTSPILECDPESVANQLTIVDAGIFRSISSSDFLKYMISSSKKRLSVVTKVPYEFEEVPSVEKFVERYNQVTNWTALQIVQLSKQKNRRLAIRKLIRIAKYCRDIGNFSSTMAIINGLLSPPVRRLKRSWDGLGKPESTMLDNLEKLTDPSDNMRRFRAEVQNALPPIVPFFPIIQRELLYIQERNPTYVDGSMDRVINFQKYREMARLIFGYMRCVEKQYAFERQDPPHPELETVIAMAPPESVLLEMSHQLEEF